MMMDYHFIENGDAGLTLLFNQDPSLSLATFLHQWRQYLIAQQPLNVDDIIPGYNSLTFSFDPLATDVPKLIQELENSIKVFQVDKDVLSNRIEIPVCYEGDFCPDMEAVETATGLSRQEIITRHSAQEYPVMMLGFLPGFLYLGDLDATLHCPRKKNPAIEVPAGAVGIGGKQTGVYPIASPGGWQIIGRTPIKLFDPLRKNPILVNPLDTIKFIPISVKEFEKTQDLSGKKDAHEIR